jgi:hypothetical protein
MVQDKRKNMNDTSDKKGRMSKEEEDRSSMNKTPTKPTTMPNKNDSSTRKSR